MDFLENISEYYDELFPVTDAQKLFFENQFSLYPQPPKFLSLCCGSGFFEHYLANNNVLTTGVESIQSLIESANRRRRTQLTTLTLFQMSNLEISHYLGKNFYDVIAVLNDRIIFINDDILLEKLFYDCKQLLSEKGRIIISFPNFEGLYKNSFNLPTKESIRVKLFSKILTSQNNEKVLNQTLETGNGKLISVTRDAKINFLTKAKVEKFAKKVGFSSVEFFADFDNKNDNCVIAVIS